MRTDVLRMACGGCGNGIYRVYTERHPRGDNDTLIVECTVCKSTTIIKPSAPTLRLQWGDDKQLGILCQMDEPTQEKL